MVGLLIDLGYMNNIMGFAIYFFSFVGKFQILEKTHGFLLRLISSCEWMFQFMLQNSIGSNYDI